MSEAARARGPTPGMAGPLLATLLEVLPSHLWLTWVSAWDVLDWPHPVMSLGGAVVLAFGTVALACIALRRGRVAIGARCLSAASVMVLLCLVVRLEQGGGYALWDGGWPGHAAEHASRIAGGLAFGGYVVWRALTVASDSGSVGYLQRRFFIGLGAIVALLVIWGVTSASGAFRQILSIAGLYVIAYFTVGLLAIALGNMQALQDEMQHHEDSPVSFRRRWPVLVTGLVLGIVTVATAVAGLLSASLGRLLLRPLSALADWLTVAFIYIVGYPLGYLGAAFAYVFRTLLRSTGDTPGREPFEPPAFPAVREVVAGQEAAGISGEWVLVLKWALVVVLVVLAVCFIVRTLLRYWRVQPDDEVEEVSESLWSLAAVQGDLSLPLSWLAGRLRGYREGQHAVARPPPATLAHDADHRLFTARELYQGLLWEARQAGVPRARWETPLEYAAHLRRRHPDAAPQVDMLTQAYVAERYGGAVGSEALLRALNRLWDTLRPRIRQGGHEPLREGGEPPEMPARSAPPR